MHMRSSVGSPASAAYVRGYLFVTRSLTHPHKGFRLIWVYPVLRIVWRNDVRQGKKLAQDRRPSD